MNSQPPVALPHFRATIDPAWIDYNGHLRDAYYGLIFSYAMDDMMDRVGLDEAYRKRTSCTLYTLELHLHYLHEVKASDELRLQNLVLDADRKRIHAGCLFHCARVSGPVAVAEAMLLHVQQGAAPATAPFPGAIDARLQALKLSTEALAQFAPTSRKIEIRRR